ncbi:MAG TPA: hypothetical protein VMV10_03635, partial [Pirellulales bacterium]|nr:hypothetical protein [Pirellulales bacterium]
PRRDCPTSGCKGRIETVTSTCRPGEIDVTIRCSACGRVRHAVLDADGVSPFFFAVARGSCSTVSCRR